MSLLDCTGDETVTLWFDAGRLETQRPLAGEHPGNGFTEAFLTDALETWDSAPIEHGLVITGDVTLEYWARNSGAPAPVIIGGEPGEGYHFFNQFGSDRTFQPAYAVEYADTASAPGDVDHYNETLTMPPGGFFIEPGDRVRVLLTSLVLDDEDGSGHDILFGGDTPSRVQFDADCWEPPEYGEPTVVRQQLELVGNQGLLTGAIPATEGVNYGVVWFDLVPDTVRLTASFTQTTQVNPLKDDLDMTLIDAAGEPVWSAGSPYSTESATLWKANLDELMPPGRYGVRVDSYSGTATTIEVTIQQDPAEARG